MLSILFERSRETPRTLISEDLKSLMDERPASTWVPEPAQSDSSETGNMDPTITLDTLPEELILAILSQIHTLSTLANLALTNRRLHRLSLPPLYHTFPGRHSELFLRTISRSPYLAAYTKVAIWQREPRTLSHISTLEKQHIINRLNELCVPHGTDLAAQFAKFGKSEEYWYFEILLLFCPNAEEVRVQESWLWDDHHYWFKSLSPFFNPLCVSKLRTVCIEGPMRIENIVPLLTIPTLRVLEVRQVTVMRREGYRVFQWSVWPVSRILPSRSSDLEVLTLRESYIDLELLIPTLERIKGLKRFTYEHMPNDLADETVQVHHLNTRALAECLSMHAASLECIRVRDTESLDWMLMAEYLFGHAPPDSNTQQTFPNLKTIDIGPAGIQGSPRSQFSSLLIEDIKPQMFPESLETLRIQPAFHIAGDSRPGGANAWALQNMRCEVDFDHLLRAQACNFAHENRRLKVQLVEWNPLLGWFPGNLPVLQQYFADVGLRLESITGEVFDFYDAEPLIMDEESEEGWVVVTDLLLATK